MSLNKNVDAEELLNACYDAGYLGFDKQYLIVALNIPEAVVREQFEAEAGDFYTAYLKGYYTAQTEIRKSVMTAALDGSTPALTKMISYFENVENELEHE